MVSGTDDVTAGAGVFADEVLAVDDDVALVSDVLERSEEDGSTSEEDNALLCNAVLLDSDIGVLDELSTVDTTLVCFGATCPPSLVPVATFTAIFPALIATISETIAAGVKNGGVRYFLVIIPPMVLL